MPVTIEVRGLKEIYDVLDRMSPKDSRKVQARATADAAKKVLKSPLQQAARPLSTRMAKAVRAGQARRDKPAAIVRFDPKIAWFRHFLIGGTRSHEIRPKNSGFLSWETPTGRAFSRGHRVRGIQATPIVSRVADQHGDEALDHVERFLVREILDE
jgi:hypothetical protein